MDDDLPIGLGTVTRKMVFLLLRRMLGICEGGNKCIYLSLR
jgi:hypothetical protein